MVLEPLNLLLDINFKLFHLLRRHVLYSEHYFTMALIFTLNEFTFLVLWRRLILIKLNCWKRYLTSLLWIVIIQLWLSSEFFEIIGISYRLAPFPINKYLLCDRLRPIKDTSVGLWCILIIPWPTSNDILNVNKHFWISFGDISSFDPWFMPLNILGLPWGYLIIIVILLRWCIVLSLQCRNII